MIANVGKIVALIGFILSFSTLHCSTKTYTNQWAVKIEGGVGVAKYIARKNGFEFVTEIMPNYYLFKHRRLSRRSIMPSQIFESKLARDSRVNWVEQQTILKRVKRDVHFNDPKWPQIWYLNRESAIDMNVVPVWKSGITGKRIVVTILDDGIEKDHPDLEQNYDARASYDVNNQDDDPQPRYEQTNENKHGTRCAGEVAAAANNKICGVGVAFEASIGGIRMLDGEITDAVEAQSLSYKPNYISIYSASWGPDDEYITVDGPAMLANRALYEGVTTGRNYSGSIFVWASGNGGKFGDSCNCDGYTNSIYTLSISSATERGKIPWYSEACSSTLATTYSSGEDLDKKIITTDFKKGCTESHTGTSASAPLAAGICALVLQANNHLTWRDIQHLVVATSRPANLESNDWVTNGAGKKVSHYFGYGLLDAYAMVEMGRNWTNVPPQKKCQIIYRGNEMGLPVNGIISLELSTDNCQINNNPKITSIEHVQAVITLSASNRGQVQIDLKSGMSTNTTLLHRRVKDTSNEGFTNWAFMSTHFWGEKLGSTWELTVYNGNSVSTLKNWTLVLYGTGSSTAGRRDRMSFDPYQSRSSYDFSGSFYRNNYNYNNYYNNHHSYLKNYGYKYVKSSTHQNCLCISKLITFVGVVFLMQALPNRPLNIFCYSLHT
ncbi:hypothetical protein HELRODRAFT_170307 [Helobdella robusta]|uniref:P/Homo B domain-containing protein n=1 Tax=Helobdella robusta TaxID=6412 RepID=T1F2W7_HELRO|nr:hypothetical protein HELRODRAFT_170307 [Helobdella robusta]ESO07759.1 hypothetical protein HELRODRAFT_170307 [Helobdella robusta]